MGKFKKKYKWSKREEHFRSVEVMLRNLKAISFLLAFPLSHQRTEGLKTFGIYSYLGVETPQGELSIIGDQGVVATPIVNVL